MFAVSDIVSLFFVEECNMFDVCPYGIVLEKYTRHFYNSSHEDVCVEYYRIQFPDGIDDYDVDSLRLISKCET